MKKNLFIILILIAFLIPFGVYCYQFQVPLSTERDDWSAFGSYMSGTYGTLGFFLLIYGYYTTNRQFKIQSENDRFFKLYESLQNRIENSQINIGEASYQGHKTLEFIVDDFYKRLMLESRYIARNILCKNPEELSITSYHKIFEAAKGLNASSYSKEQFVSDMTNAGDFNSRWEFVKSLIGTQGSEDPKIGKALEEVGSVLFYKISFSDRKLKYINVLGEILDEHGAFLDVYFKNMSFLVTYAANTSEKELYFKFIKSQLSKYELILLFYFITGNAKPEKTHVLINKFLLNEDFGFDCNRLMIDFPGKDQIKSDLYDALN